MLHHVGIEVAPAEIERSVEFWQALGFERVEPPASLAEYIWLEREGTQIHLMSTDEPTVPPAVTPRSSPATSTAMSPRCESGASTWSRAASTGARGGLSSSPRTATGSS